MNISRIEQRILHVLAQGGRIRYARTKGNNFTDIVCITRDGFGFPACTPEIFRKLKGKRLIEASSGNYRISKSGRLFVQARLDNR